MENTFQQLGLPSNLVDALAQQGITEPTEIQKMMIPMMDNGTDIIARSQTGTGKTLSYLLPIFKALNLSVRGTQAIILTPTHELASQVYREAQILAEDLGMEDSICALMIGSANIQRQLDRLKTKPRIVVGSAGRILDLIQRKKIQAHLVKTIVLDEGDRLLEDGHIADIQAVVKTTLKERQVVILSASIGAETKERAKTILKEDFVTLEAKSGAVVPSGISHYYILATQRDKFFVLRKILAGEKPQRAMVFINNPENIEVTVDKLCHHGILADGIYGQAGKLERKNALDAFREGRIHVLVASDIGARGLDIPNVTHIINLDVPEEPTFYLHRAGRSGRNGNTGVAITIVTPYERRWMHRYEKVWGISFEQKEMSYGKLVDSKKTKNDLDIAPKFKKKAAQAKQEEDFFFEEERKSERQASKKTGAKNKPPKAEKTQDLEENLGFLAMKAKKKAIKEENRRKSQKK